MAPPSETPSSGPHSARSARLGQRVGPFQLMERLALRDDIGLYRATRPVGSRTPHTVAIRIAEDVRDDRAAAWVHHEYDILSRLDDPRIPKAYGYYSSQVGVATSLPPKLTLDDILEARRQGRVPLDVPTAVDILVELAEALRHVHSIAGPDGPICHGHLCPEVVGLASDGAITLLGLGAPPKQVPLGYCPPEQVAGAFVDGRSDQWRLGALMVELILGTALYSGLDDPEAAAGTGRVGPWLGRLERRQPPLARIASKLLAQAAGNRYPSEHELVRDLLESARIIGGRPDRRALSSRVLAVREADSRRHAEASTTIEPARAPDPESLTAQEPPAAYERVPAPPVHETVPRTLAREAVVDETSVPDPGTVVAVKAPAREPVAVPVEPNPDDDGPILTTVQVEIDDDDPSLGLGRVAVADHEEDGPSLGSNLPGLPHTPDPFNDPLEAGGTLNASDIVHAAIDAPIGAPSVEERSEPVQEGAASDTPADRAVEATEVVHRPTPAAPRQNKWFASELVAMACIGIVALTAIAFVVWRFG